MAMAMAMAMVMAMAMAMRAHFANRDAPWCRLRRVPVAATRIPLQRSR